jgi:flagellar hook protein FlgE
MSSLLTAVSGLRNHQVWLDVIGDNIANTNTPGYKGATIVFSDLLAQTLSSGGAPTAETGGTNPIQMGTGMTVGSVSPSFSQGSIQTTNRATDVAIQGEGFFVLANGADRAFGRAGAFSLDANGNLVDGATGFKVQGATGDIQITLGQESGATPTTTAEFKGNLDASAADGVTHVATLNIRDSLGSPHTLTVTFTRNFAAAPGRWDWAVTEADANITGLTTATGSVVFGATGAISSGASQAIGITYGAAAGVTTPQAVTLDFGTAANDSAITGLSGPSTVALSTQDGQPTGSLQSFSIGIDGSVSGFFSNGTNRVLDTVQLAMFNNPAGLLKIGQNHFRASSASGTASEGNPGSAGRGTLVGGSLESSNVDLAQEFANMIIAQRGFQANARTISTSSEMLEELVNLTR